MRSIVGAYKLSQNDDNPSQNLFEALHVRSGRKFLAQKIPSDENLLQQLRDISIDLRHVLCREDIFEYNGWIYVVYDKCGQSLQSYLCDLNDHTLTHLITSIASLLLDEERSLKEAVGVTLDLHPQNMFLSVTEEEGDTKLTVNCLYPSAMDCATRGLAVKEGNILIKTLSTASTKPQCQSAEPADKQAMILALDVLTAQINALTPLNAVPVGDTSLDTQSNNESSAHYSGTIVSSISTSVSDKDTHTTHVERENNEVSGDVFNAWDMEITIEEKGIVRDDVAHEDDSAMDTNGDSFTEIGLKGKGGVALGYTDEVTGTMSDTVFRTADASCNDSFVECDVAGSDAGSDVVKDTITDIIDSVTDVNIVIDASESAKTDSDTVNIDEEEADDGEFVLV